MMIVTLLGSLSQVSLASSHSSHPSHSKHTSLKPGNSHLKVPRVYKTRRKDTLSRLASLLYARQSFWKKLKEDNSELSDLGPNDPVPPSTTIHYLAPWIGKTYKLKKTDTLSRLARWKYGNTSCWKVIFKDNQSSLSDGDQIHPGTVLSLRDSCGKKTASTRHKSPHPTDRPKHSDPVAPKTEPHRTVSSVSQLPQTHSNQTYQFADLSPEAEATTPQGSHQEGPSLLPGKLPGTAGSFTISFGLTTLIYQQAGSRLTPNSVTEIGTHLKLAGDHSLDQTNWRVMYSAAAMYPLIWTTPSTNSLTTFEGEGRIAKDMHLTDSGWFFRPGLGFRFMSSLSSQSLGYDNLIGPELYLDFHKNKGRNISFDISLKYAQIINPESITSLLGSRNLSLTLDYKFSELGLYFDAGWLSYALAPDNSISSYTFGLGVNYAF